MGGFAVTSLTSTGTLNLSCSISGAQSQANASSCSVQPSISFFSPGGTDGLAYTVTTQATTPAGQYSITITAMDAAGGVPPFATSARGLSGRSRSARFHVERYSHRDCFAGAQRHVDHYDQSQRRFHRKRGPELRCYGRAHGSD